MFRLAAKVGLRRRISLLKTRRYLSSADAMLDPSQETQSSELRLSTAFDLLHTPKRLKYTTNECYNHYRRANANLIEDLIQNREKSRAVVSLLAQTYSKSKLVSALVLDELCSLLCQRKNDVFVAFVSEMASLGLLSQNVSTQWAALQLTPSKTLDLGSILISQALDTGEPLLAVLLVLRLHSSGLELDNSALNLLVANLAVHSPMFQAYNSYATMKLIDTFGQSRITYDTLLCSIESMIPVGGVPYFANVLYDRIEPKFSDQKFLLLTGKVISANLASGNYVRATRLWKDVMLAQNVAGDILFAKTHSGLFRRMMEFLAGDKKTAALDLVKNYFPRELDSQPETITFLIKFYSQCGEKSLLEQLIRNLEPPLQRQTLSALLALFLTQDNEKGAERLLKAIFATPSGLNCDDFDAIVAKLLKLQKVQQALDMCKKNHVRVAKYGYARLLDFFLLHDHISGDTDILTEDLKPKGRMLFSEIVLRLPALENGDPAHKRITNVLFAHLSRKVNAGSCRKLYTCTAYKETRRPFNFASHGLPNEFNQLVYMDHSNRLGCVLIILKRAVWENDKDNIAWCVEEMRALGVPGKDIKEYIGN